MRTVAPWDTDLSTEVGHFFDRFIERGEGPFEPIGEWVPMLDVLDTNDSIVVQAEMPGMEAKDIAVTLRERLLTLKGERERTTERGDERYLCSERTYGTFFRTIRLPTAVEASKVTTTFKNGVLTVTLPKSPANGRRCP
jgi:HSP20 family protein